MEQQTRDGQYVETSLKQKIKLNPFYYKKHNQDTKDIPLENLKYFKVVCLSDTHGKHDKINVPDGDILIHSGDFTLKGGQNEIENFINFLKKLPHKYKIVIAGNHDIPFDDNNFKDLDKNFYDGKYPIDNKIIKEQLKKECIYLENESINILNYNFYGSPYSLEFHNWAFMYKENEAPFIWGQIPDNTDILITHGPPFEIQDKVKNGQNVGCKCLKEEILNRVKPLYHIFGHIHEDAGQQKVENTQFINASNLNFKYKVVNKPITFKLPNKNFQKSQQQQQNQKIIIQN